MTRLSEAILNDTSLGW